MSSQLASLHPALQLAASRATHVRDADYADRTAMRAIVTAAFEPYAAILPEAVYPSWLAELLDLDRHALHGDLLVAEFGHRIIGCGAFYYDIGDQGMGWPAGWAGGRGLAVDPHARGLGAARLLLAECERRARWHGAPVFAFHTSAFMTGAVALYERVGYRRAPEFDLDLAEHLGFSTTTPIPFIAYLRELRPGGHR